MSEILKRLKVSSPSKSESQADPSGPAAIEPRKPELLKPEIKREPRPPKQSVTAVPEFDDMIKYCFEHIHDTDCQTFLAHNLPPRQMRTLSEKQTQQLGIVEIRKGGGHSGATKLALTVLRKMRNQ
jgi:hypothetical protein